MPDAADPVGGAPARDAEGTTRRILGAAIAAFAERGYDGASTRDIAGRAGVDPRLITRYFGSKEALFEKAVELTYEHPLLMVPGRNLEVARALLDDAPLAQAQGLLLTVRSAGNERAAEIMRSYAERHYQRQLADALPAGVAADPVDALARAALLIAVCAGVQLQRNVLRNAVLRGGVTDGLVRRLAAALDLIGRPGL